MEGQPVLRSGRKAHSTPSRRLRLVISNAQTGASFRLSEIATLSRGLQDTARSLHHIDGKPAIGLGVGNSYNGWKHHIRFMLIYDSENSSSSYGQILVDVADDTQIEGLQGPIESYIQENYPSPRIQGVEVCPWAVMRLLCSRYRCLARRLATTPQSGRS